MHSCYIIANKFMNLGGGVGLSFALEGETRLITESNVDATIYHTNYKLTNLK